jgi:hypothetical protein
MRDQVDLFVRQVDRARNLYDTIFIDCPPSLSPATRAALQASDSYLVPVQAEELCRDSLGTLIATVDSYRDQVFGPRCVSDAEGLDRPLEIEGIFLTMTNNRTRMSRHVSTRVADEFGPVLFNTTVPRSTRLSEMALRGKPAVVYDRLCRGSRAYFDLADELVLRFSEREGTPPPDIITYDAQPMDDVELPGFRKQSSAMEAGGGPMISGGLDQLLRDLKANGLLRRPSVPTSQDMEDTEVVSLEDLLAEEEKDSRSGDWDDAWETGGRRS